MKVAYLVTAYDEPELLDMLATTLLGNGGKVFIHIDRKSNLDVSALECFKNVIFVKNPVSIYWGDYNLTEAIIRLIETALENDEFEYFHCLSGTDLPVRPLDEFTSFLDSIQPKSIFSARAVDLNRFEDKKRVCSRYIFQRRTKISNILQTLVFIFSMTVAPRRYALDAPLKFGDTWITVSHRTAEGLVAAWRDPKVFDFFSKTFCADEMFFQTYIRHLNSDDTLETRRIRYIAWMGQPRPKVLDMSDYDAIKESGAYFARKFHPKTSGALIERIRSDVAKLGG